MSLYADLQKRGLLHQETNTKISEILDGDPITFYAGFDPTSSSLHVGHLLPLTMMKRLQLAGHHGIALIGGGTGLIGDPSGKETERPMLDRETLSSNVAWLAFQLGSFFSTSPSLVRVEDNADWLTRVPLTTFLRDVGKHFSVNAMLTRDSVKRRIEDREQGISYTEFSYMLLQAYDFLQLFDSHGCTLQIGGSDQWGNIVSGCDLIRRKRLTEVHGFTMPLLYSSNGKKFGKSEGENIWLDPAKTSPFEFYQYFLNVSDEDVIRLLRQLTFLGLTEIDQIEFDHRREPGNRLAQRWLAHELTEAVHGKSATFKVHKANRILFEDFEFSDFSEDDLKEAFGKVETFSSETAQLVDILVGSGLCISKTSARREIGNGSISVNNQKITDIDYILKSSDLLHDSYVFLRHGKRKHKVMKIVVSA